MKKILLIIGMFLLTVLLGGLFLAEFRQTSPIPFLQGAITPTPVPLPGKTFENIPLKVIQTIPKNGEENVDTTSSIVLLFNKPFTPSDISVSLSPDVTFVSTASGQKIIVTPQEEFISGIIYSYSVFSKDENIFTGSFSTKPVNPSITPYVPLQGVYDNIQQQGDLFDKQNYPDVYIENQLPYSEITFSIVSRFVSGDPVGHYAFTVTSLNGDKTKAKDNFISWLKRIGLTQEEIDKLDVSYQ